MLLATFGTSYSNCYGDLQFHFNLSSQVRWPSKEIKSEYGDIFELERESTSCSNRMEFYGDKSRTKRVFAVGDKVYLKLYPYKQNYISLWNNLKLSSRYVGPYTVLRKISEVACKLVLFPDTEIHHAFHVSLLKPIFGDEIILCAAMTDNVDDELFVLSLSSVVNSLYYASW